MTSLLHLVISFLTALILTIIPLPELLVPFRPPWILLLVLYLQFYLPRYFKVVLLLLLGLILDTLLASILGEHVFALCLVSWVASRKARRFCYFSIGQQMTLIGFFSGLYHLSLLLIDAFSGFHTSILTALGSILVSVLIWPWIRLLGEEFIVKDY